MSKLKKHLIKDYVKSSYNLIQISTNISITHIVTTVTTTTAKAKTKIVQGKELTKWTTEIQTLINEILKNVKSEVNQYWQKLRSLKTFLQQEINNFQAGQMKYKICE